MAAEHCQQVREHLDDLVGVDLCYRVSSGFWM